MSRDKSCSIFVGNVPYDADEEELKDLFSKAGAVTSLRVVCDRDTNQPKGYAFCDFAEKSSVENAIDKCNNAEYRGRRLRVDFAERELSRRGGDEGGGSGRPVVSGPTGPPPADPVLQLPVTTVADRLARIREHEAAEQARKTAFEQAELAELARFVETLTPQQLFTIVGEMQRLSLRAPEVARALVSENVQLCLVLQHAQFLLGLAEEAPLPTDPEVREQARNVKRKVFGETSTAPIGAAMPGMPPLPQMAPHLAPGGLLGFPGGLTAPGAMGFPAAAGLGQLQALAAVLAAGQAQLAAAPPVATPPSMPNLVAAPGNEEGNKQELLGKLSKLTPAQIDQLPHDTKIQVLGFLQSLPAQT